MNNKASAIPVIIVGLVIAATLIGALVFFNYKISSTGSIKTIGVAVFADQTGTIPVSSINWGLLSPGDKSLVTLYIKNTGNAPANLTFTTSNWNPTNAVNFMTLSWNYTGAKIAPNVIIPVVYTLTISTSIIGITNFSFDITIIASG